MVSGISGQNNWNNIQINNDVSTKQTEAGGAVKAKSPVIVDTVDNSVHSAAPDAVRDGGVTLPPKTAGGAAKAAVSNDGFDVEINTGDDSTGEIPCKLADLKQWPAFKALSSADQSKVLSVVTAGKGSPAVVVALGHLVTNKDFLDSSDSTRATLLTQCKYYPDATSIDNLGRLAGVSWFKDMDAADMQRAAKSIGYISKHGQTTPGSEQNTIITNTLDRLLSGEVRMDFHEFDDDPGYITYGHSHTWEKCISINNALVPDGDSKFPEGKADARHAVLSTLPHEISHAVNDDKNTDTYKYFQAEYRAWFVGYIAEYGKHPTRQEAYDRCVELFECYPNIDAARTDTWFGLVTDSDARKIIRFVEQFSAGLDLNVKDPDSADAILDLKVTDPKKSAPIPDTSINYDFDN